MSKSNKSSGVVGVVQWVRAADRYLLLALLLAVVFSVNGMGWGRVECWNRDEMGLRTLGAMGLPGDYLHPPLYTFVNHILVKSPLDGLEKVLSVATHSKVNLNEAKLLGSRLLVMSLFLGTIMLAFQFALQFYGLRVARVIALVFATSAGFVTYNHYLSCDSPLVFSMMLALFFSTRVYFRGTRNDYLLAGFLVGAATNVKYNGLAMGIALVAAHVLSSRPRNFGERFFGKDLILGILMVPAGFIITDPFVLFDFRRFCADFMYVNVVTPRYEGQAEGVGYWAFLKTFPEVFGVPGTILLWICVVFSLWCVARKRCWRSPETAGFLIVSSVFLLYFAKMGAFPRMETRYAFPSMPFFVLMSGPFLAAAYEKRAWLNIVWIPIFAYNALCSVYVGERFKADPRLPAQLWMAKNASPHARIESSGGAPHWRKLPSLNAVEVDATNPSQKGLNSGGIVDFRMLHVNGREELFQKVFKGNKWVEGRVADHEGSSSTVGFNLPALLERNPDIVAIDSCDYLVPSPVVQSYYASLMQEKFPYKIAFDQDTPPIPTWVYPRKIDFLRDRTIILVRK